MGETKKSKRNLIVAVIFGAALLAGVAVAAINISRTDDGQPTTPSQAETRDGDAAEAEETETITFTAVAGRNVLEQTREHAEVETEDAGFGAYVNAINGLHGGTDNKYWTYSVNGEPATVGAADYETEGGETIEWRFESFE